MRGMGSGLLRTGSEPSSPSEQPILPPRARGSNLYGGTGGGDGVCTKMSITKGSSSEFCVYVRAGRVFQIWRLLEASNLDVSRKFHPPHLPPSVYLPPSDHHPSVMSAFLCRTVLSVPKLYRAFHPLSTDRAISDPN